ncbi:hypothetical protein OQA88_3583 [Cercophora sp. LCS_1]
MSNTSDSSVIPAPILTLPTCLIRRHHASDIPRIAQLANNPNIAHRLRSTFPSPYTLADAETFVNRALSNKESLHYAICDPLTNEFMGGIAIRPMAADETLTYELGYWLGEPYWGRGIMTDAARGFSRWVFENWNEDKLQRLEAHIYETNKGSKAVVSKAGFVLEGTKRRAGFKHGEVFDVFVFGMIRDDLKSS